MSENKEIIIKSKKRVQKHGEVFTPKKIVKMMLDQPGIKEACESLEATFLEPSAGEGAFLVEILRRKLEMVMKEHNKDILKFENYSLFALTTLYGIELLEDNAQRCVMNMYQLFIDYYREAAKMHHAKTRDRVFRAAQYIISTNIVQGNFLTREKTNGEPIVFSEWKLIKRRAEQIRLKVQRTEHTLQEIVDNVEHEPGYIHGTPGTSDVLVSVQLSLFDFLEEEEEEIDDTVYRYADSYMEDIHLEEVEEVEEVDESNTN